ncbi:hypothetical protein LUZ62_045867 [Rhynchospora pubera]|uniref:CCHC-type domain-containing protein n=1 Tax=Rhynchospora pubera TaxID=906938 RepID=A0AAV8FUS7_9POAL|nr:hypothetical protein LUZ62_045867 [Rhynchospora pubera]
MLNHENYGLWAIKMKIIMRSLCVWEAIDGSASIDAEKDHGAMAAISQAVPDDVMMAIAEKEIAKEAWEAIKEMSIGEDRVKKARAQVLKRQFDRIIMDDSDNILDFSRRFTCVVSEIRSLGEELKESTVVEKLFGVVPDRFLPIIGTIEQWGDMTTMSVTEAIGRLRVFEESLKGRRKFEEEEEQLLLTRAQWEALALKEKKDVERKRPYKKFDKSKVKCFNCVEYGHFASECTQFQKEKAYVVEVEDDEPALLMLEASELM